MFVGLVVLWVVVGVIISVVNDLADAQTIDLEFPRPKSQRTGKDAL